MFNIKTGLPSLYPSSARWLAEKLYMTFILLLKNVLCRMITNQARPPWMSFKFGPHNVIQFNLRIIALVRSTSWFSLFYVRFLSINWRKSLGPFFGRMVFPFLRCFTANWRGRFLRLWRFGEVREKRGHVYLLDQFHENFPAFPSRVRVSVGQRPGYTTQRTSCKGINCTSFSSLIVFLPFGLFLFILTADPF